MNRIGTVALKLYANSLLWFTIGAVCEGVFVALLLIPHLRGG